MPDDAGVPGLAEKLNHLFANVPRSNGGGYHTNDTAAHALNEAGVAISSVYLSHMRSGRRTNPSARLLAAIAQMFGVPIAYFFNDELEQQINSELASLAALRDSEVKGLMLRARGMSRPNLKLLRDIVDSMRRSEGLDAMDEEEDDNARGTD